MDWWVVLGLMFSAAAVGGLVVVWFAPGRGGAASTWQQQLIEVRGRLDELVRSQQELPVTLAQNRAAQAATLTREFADLAGLVTTQLSRAEQTMGDRLSDTGSVVADVRERLGQLAEATQRLETLGTTIGEVQNLLRVPHLRGALGEVWLEELLRQIFPNSLYQMQYTFPSGERVDAVLHLGPRLVPIDAKFPLDVAERLSTASHTDRVRVRKAFERSVRARIEEIADRYIRPADGTYDFGLMYIPSEKVFAEVVNTPSDGAADGGVMAYAMTRRVIPVSPNTFYAYLMAILHGLRGLEVESRAEEVLRLLEQVASEVERCVRAHEVAGKHLDHAARQHGDMGQSLARIHEQVVRFAEPTPTPDLTPAHSKPESPHDPVSAHSPRATG